MSEGAIRFLPLSAARRYLKPRGFAITPPLDENLLGREVRLGFRKSCEYGFWWKCRIPRVMYRFHPDDRCDAARRIIEWAGAWRMLFFTSQVRDWRRLLAERAVEESFHDKAIAVVDSSAGLQESPRSFWERIFMPWRAPRLRPKPSFGALVLENWEPGKLAELAAGFIWVPGETKKGPGELDVYIVPVGAKRTIKLMHEGAVFFYSDSKPDLDTFEAICTGEGLCGTKVSEEQVSNEVIGDSEGRPMAWVDFKGGTMSRAFEDIPYVDYAAPQTFDAVTSIHVEDGLVVVRLGEDEVSADKNAVVLFPGEARRLAKALRNAAESLEAGKRFERVLLKPANPQAIPGSAIAVTLGTQGVTLAIAKSGPEARFSFGRTAGAIGFAGSLEKAADIAGSGSASRD